MHALGGKRARGAQSALNRVPRMWLQNVCLLHEYGLLCAVLGESLGGDHASFTHAHIYRIGPRETA
jgi:hypothetical protein